MDHRPLSMPDRASQDHHFASAQPWNYSTIASGMPLSHGFGPGPYSINPYSFGAQSPQVISGFAPYAPGHDIYHNDFHRPMYTTSGYHGGHDTRMQPRTQAYQSYQNAMLQKQPGFSTMGASQHPSFGGMIPLLNGSNGYLSHQVPHYDLRTLQPHLPDGPKKQTIGSNHYASPLSPTRFQTSHSGTPPSPQMPRGPPRKPKRSGHAIWVGNIPLGASIESLKDHFSKDATSEIESVFLMSKSNCAFVNYTTEEACTAAVERFNHSLLGSVRLLCRLRKDASSREGSNSSGSARRSPKPSESTTSSAASSSDQLDEALTGLGISEDNEVETSEASSNPVPIDPKPSDRYFVLKSLTKEDLQDSLMKGTWETQSHNQQVLHEAFTSASNVYVVFSVNKSGEYFGYARMTSSPLDTSSRPPSNPHHPHSPTTANDNFRMRKTPETATAPRGYIIDDPARGTLFWEADHNSPDSIVSSDGVRPCDTDVHPRSRPFQIEWLSVRRVTFQRTKGMRNSWNANKEVKVARDGTELETEVGRKVVGLFHETVEERRRG